RPETKGGAQSRQQTEQPAAGAAFSQGASKGIKVPSVHASSFHPRCSHAPAYPGALDAHWRPFAIGNEPARRNDPCQPPRYTGFWGVMYVVLGRMECCAGQPWANLVSRLSAAVLTKLPPARQPTGSHPSYFSPPGSL